MTLPSFRKFHEQNLEEKLVVFGKSAYPKFGNVVIMAGGAGSGKGYVLKNLLGIEGKVLDVDALKTLASKSVKINAKVEKEAGTTLSKLTNDLRNPENVSKLHTIISDMLDLPNKRERALFMSIFSAPQNRKPNLIFDVTLKDMRKLEKITQNVTNIGYDKRNIHIVWVVNDIEVAKIQNQKRSRVVPTEILVNTHRGVSSTMNDILSMGEAVTKYMDGDIVFVFNKFRVDSDVKTSKFGGKYISDANYIYLKRIGKAPRKISSINADIRQKINDYTPNDVIW